MKPMEELKKLAEEHEEVKNIVNELNYVEEAFETEMPESEIKELVDYFKVRFSDCSRLEKIEADNKFKLSQIKKLADIIDLTYEERKELEKGIELLELMFDRHKDVEVLSERLIVNEKFTNLLDDIFQTIMLRAGH